MVWEVLLYMCCFYCLIKKLLSANYLTEFSQTGRAIQLESRQTQEMPWSHQRDFLPSQIQRLIADNGNNSIQDELDGPVVNVLMCRSVGAGLLIEVWAILDFCISLPQHG